MSWDARRVGDRLTHQIELRETYMREVEMKIRSGDPRAPSYRSQLDRDKAFVAVRYHLRHYTDTRERFAQEVDGLDARPLLARHGLHDPERWPEFVRATLREVRSDFLD